MLLDKEVLATPYVTYKTVNYIEASLFTFTVHLLSDSEQTN